MKLFLAATTAATLLGNAHGHGYMFEPLTRNYFAAIHGATWGETRDVPPAEYCTHCLNTKGPNQVCGTSESGTNYDHWLDTYGLPMTWNSNDNVYREGDVITIKSFLTAHHNGHMEVRACPWGRDSTQACFDLPEHALTFVEDVAFDMPADPNHPERGYYYGSSEFNNNEFEMRFKLPDGLVGGEVLLQWWYFTANSCSPEGYADYYGANTGLPQDFWNSELAVCTPEQWTEEFYAGDWPERFVNCAEVTILSENADLPVSTQEPVDPIDTPDIAPPVPSPTPEPTPEPTPSEVPDDNDNNTDSGEGCCSNDYKNCASWCSESRNQCEEDPSCANMKWLENGSLPEEESCAPRWGECTNTGDAGCCEGLVCKGDSPWWKQCLAPADPAPSN